jgi:hypothetical protein
LLYAQDRVCEGIAVPSHDFVLNSNVVELLLQARVKSAFAVRIVVYARLKKRGPSRPGKGDWDQLLRFNVGRGAL